jgi:hypothetical protein
MERAEGQAEPQAGPDAAPGGGALRPLRRAGRVSVRLGLKLLGFALFLPVITAVLVGALMFDQTVPAPSWVVAAVEERAAAVLEGGRLDFGTIALRVGRDLHPHVEISDAVLRDAEGRVLVRVPLIVVQMSPRGLVLRREILPQVIRIVGTEVALQRAMDGRLAVSLGGIGGIGTGAAGQAENIGDLLDQIDGVFDRPGLDALERVSVEGLIARIEDSRAGRVWTVDGGELELDLTGGQTRLMGVASLLSGRPVVTRAQFSYSSPRDSPEARIAIVVTEAAAEDIAAQSPSLSWLSVLDAPLSAAFRMEIDGAGTLGPLSAALKLGQGALAPVNGAPPVGFDLARVYFTFDPATDAIRFAEIEAESDWGGFRAEGETLLQGMEAGWPSAFLGQFRLEDIALNPAGIYPEPVVFAEAFADLRLTLEPFRVSLAQVAVTDAAGRLAEGEVARGMLTGEIAAAPEGWTVALDTQVDALSTARLMALWPLGFRPGMRGWFDANVTGGELTEFSGALRRRPGAEAEVAATYGFGGGMEVRVLPAQPPVTGAAGTAWYQDHSFVLTLDQGEMRPAQGGAVDLAGTALIVPDNRVPNPPSILRWRSQSTITATMAVLDAPPFGLIARSGLPVTMADGRIGVAGDIRLPLGRAPGPGELDWDLSATMTDLRSDVIVPGREIAASDLRMRTDPGVLEIGGAMTLDGVPAEATWRLPLGPGAGEAEIRGEVELSQRFLEAFGIGLPEGTLRGEGLAQVVIGLPQGEPPRFEISSDLAGVGLSLPQIGWSLGRGAGGRFEAEGSLGAVPQVSRIMLDAPGLEAEGRIALRADGGLERVSLDRVEIGGWFEGAADLVGRGAGRVVGLEVRGGRMDLAAATLGGGGAGGGGPVTVRLQELRVTEGVTLTDLVAEIDTSAGVQGRFTALVNGGPAVEGRLVPGPGGAEVQLRSDRAGAVLRAAGFFAGAEGGRLDLSLAPTGREGEYEGRLAIDGLRVTEAPALAQLLNAFSVFGLLQQMAGQGIVFDEVRADFRIDPEKVTLRQSSAVGVGLGLSLDGVYARGPGTLDMQGVLSPFYLVNAVGEVLTRRGEGLLGFSFRLTGPIADFDVAVNPLSVLTPGMFRELFRRPPPE